MVKATYTAYTYPSIDDSAIHELMLSTTLPGPLAPSAALAFEFSKSSGADKGIYLELGVAPAIPMGDDAPATITVPVKFGFSLKDYYELGGNDNKFGWFDIGGLLTVPFTGVPSKFGAWNFHAGVDLLVFGKAAGAKAGDGLKHGEKHADLPKDDERTRKVLRGRTVINLFFETSTRTSTSFELAAKRLGGDVITMSVGTSSIKKGETLLDTAMTLNAMKPDVMVVRHNESGAVNLLSQKVDGSVINAGDGRHEHPTQALLDALTIRRRLGKLNGLLVAICGDILHSRVARSNIHLLSKMGARVRVIAPLTLLPSNIDRMGVEVFTDMKKGLKDVDIVMMLRLQLERMQGAYVPSTREYFRFYGLDYAKLALAKPDALIMHPGPMNRGVEIDSEVADDINRSVIREQVEMGVAVRMACLDALTRNLTGNQ